MARINTHVGSLRRNALTLLTPYAPTPKGEAASAHDPRNSEPAGPYRSQSSVPSIRSQSTAHEHGGVSTAPGSGLPSSPRPTVTLAPPSSPTLGSLLSTATTPTALTKLSSLLSPTPLGVPAVPTPLVVPSALEKKTLGSPSLEEILEAGKQGELAVNQGGKLTVPRTRQAAQTLAGARADLARSTGLTGPLTPGQKILAEQVGRETNLSPRVVGAQELAEENGSFAQQREAEGNHNWLNIGYFDSGPGGITQSSRFRSPVAAAHATSQFLKGQWGGASSGIQSILDTAGKSPQSQIAAIGRSGWASNPAYAQSIASTYQQIGERHDPQAVQAFHAATQQARAVGLNPTPFNGDVNRSGNTVFVRADAQGMVHWADSAVGTAEGSPKQQHWAAKTGLGSSQPWCADFISAGLSRRGVPLPPNPNYVPSYEKEWSGGHNIGTDLSKAKPGDLIAFSGEHIGLYVGNGEMVSGNFGNEVARSAVSAGPAPVSAILRPSYKGGKVAVHESAVALPGSSPGSTFASSGVAGAAGAAPAGAATGAVAAARQATPLTQLAAPISAGPVLPNLAGGSEEAEGGAGEALAQLLASRGLNSSTPRRRTLLGS